MSAMGVTKRLFNQLMIARVVDSLSPLKETIRVHVPYMIKNDKFNMYFKQNDVLHVHDPQELAKPGDIVIVKELHQPISLLVKHSLVNVIYQTGNVTDPITGRQCFGDKYVDELEKLGELLGQKPRYKAEQLKSGNSIPEITN